VFAAGGGEVPHTRGGASNGGGGDDMRLCSQWPRCVDAQRDMGCR